MDEQQLIIKAKEGDLQAFNHLVLTYQEVVYNCSYRILSDPAGACDITQDTFITAYQKIDKFKNGSFKAWLLRVATNKCLDEIRRQKRHPNTALEPLTNDDQETFDSPYWLTDDTPLPEEQLSQSELNQAVQDCLARLPEDFRSIVVMVDMQEMNYSETAQIIGIPLGTIKSRLARARKRLQDCLQRFSELLPSQFRFNQEEQ
ncbi:MAG: sigma-70 family RNA polymerase sigma factor [Anaerolineaceae bacterium]|nr:sigma-70 family RNA polymerase sigma factor [Anaerolineaceae bacterium]